MEMGGGSAKAIKKKKTALPWKCSHLGGGEDGKKRGSRNSGMGTLGGGPGRRAHTGQRTLSPLCWEGFLEQRGRRRNSAEDPGKPTWNINIPPSKAVLEEQMRKEGPRRTGKPK